MFSASAAPLRPQLPDNHTFTRLSVVHSHRDLAAAAWACHAMPCAAWPGGHSAAGDSCPSVANMFHAGRVCSLPNHQTTFQPLQLHSFTMSVSVAPPCCCKNGRRRRAHALARLPYSGAISVSSTRSGLSSHEMRDPAASRGASRKGRSLHTPAASFVDPAVLGDVACKLYTDATAAQQHCHSYAAAP